MTIIDIQRLTKIYDGKAVPVIALSGIDLKFERGEFTAIVGPSGSGKTTLLNMIGGLDDPTSGLVMIDNVNMTSLTSAQKTRFRMANIGFVFQSFNLIPVLTVTENIEFIMQLQGISKAHRMKRVDELLEATGLTDKRHVRPSYLSGGQQQRVAVARALAARPKFVLADEPTANLDTKSTDNLLEMMERLNREEDVTFIFSTHDVRVMNKARRIITIEDGKVKNDR